MYEAQDLGSGREYALKGNRGLRLRGSPRVPREGVSSTRRCLRRGLSPPLWFVPLSYSLCLLVTVDSSAVLEGLESCGFQLWAAREGNQNCQSRGSQEHQVFESQWCAVAPRTGVPELGSRAGCWLCLESVPRLRGPAWPQGSGRLGVWLGWGARTWALGPRSSTCLSFSSSLLVRSPSLF